MWKKLIEICLFIIVTLLITIYMHITSWSIYQICSLSNLQINPICYWLNLQIYQKNFWSQLKIIQFNTSHTYRFIQFVPRWTYRFIQNISGSPYCSKFLTILPLVCSPQWTSPNLYTQPAVLLDKPRLYLRPWTIPGQPLTAPTLSLFQLSLKIQNNKFSDVKKNYRNKFIHHCYIINYNIYAHYTLVYLSNLFLVKLTDLSKNFLPKPVYPPAVLLDKPRLYLYRPWTIPGQSLTAPALSLFN